MNLLCHRDVKKRCINAIQKQRGHTLSLVGIFPTWLATQMLILCLRFVLYSLVSKEVTSNCVKLMLNITFSLLSQPFAAGQKGP